MALAAVSRAPAEKLTAYLKRMGWSFPWVSSGGSSFNFDFGVSFTQESAAGGAEYNFREMPAISRRPPPRSARDERLRARRRYRLPHLLGLRPRLRRDVEQARMVLHRAPLGRNEQGMTWFHRHDEYPM